MSGSKMLNNSHGTNLGEGETQRWKKYGGGGQKTFSQQSRDIKTPTAFFLWQGLSKSAMQGLWKAAAAYFQSTDSWFKIPSWPSLSGWHGYLMPWDLGSHWYFANYVQYKFILSYQQHKQAHRTLTLELNVNEALHLVATHWTVRGLLVLPTNLTWH